MTVLGAPSTRSLASFRPRPVAARTTLMTWIFLSPPALRTTSKVVFSSASSAGGAAAATAGAGHHDRAAGGGLDAVGFLEVVGEVDRLLEGQADDLVAEFLDFCSNFCHDFILRGRVGVPTVSNIRPVRELDFTAKRFNPARGAVGPSDVRFRSASFRGAAASFALRAAGVGAAAAAAAGAARRASLSFAFSSIVLRIAPSLPPGPLRAPASLRPGPRISGDELADRFLAGRQLADLLDALVADVDFAVEEDAAQLDLVVGLLLVEQQPGDRRRCSPCRRSRRWGRRAACRSP